MNFGKHLVWRRKWPLIVVLMLISIVWLFSIQQQVECATLASGPLPNPTVKISPKLSPKSSIIAHPSPKVSIRPQATIKPTPTPHVSIKPIPTPHISLKPSPHPSIRPLPSPVKPANSTHPPQPAVSGTVPSYPSSQTAIIYPGTDGSDPHSLLQYRSSGVGSTVYSRYRKIVLPMKMYLKPLMGDTHMGPSSSFPISTLDSHLDLCDSKESFDEYLQSATWSPVIGPHYVQLAQEFTFQLTCETKFCDNSTLREHVFPKYTNQSMTVDMLQSLFVQTPIYKWNEFFCKQCAIPELKSAAMANQTSMPIYQFDDHYIRIRQARSMCASELIPSSDRPVIIPYALTETFDMPSLQFCNNLFVLDQRATCGDVFITQAVPILFYILYIFQLAGPFINVLLITLLFIIDIIPQCCYTMFIKQDYKDTAGDRFKRLLGLKSQSIVIVLISFLMSLFGTIGKTVSHVSNQLETHFEDTLGGNIYYVLYTFIGNCRHIVLFIGLFVLIVHWSNLHEVEGRKKPYAKYCKWQTVLLLAIAYIYGLVWISLQIIYPLEAILFQWKGLSRIVIMLIVIVDALILLLTLAITICGFAISCLLCCVSFGQSASQKFKKYMVKFQSNRFTATTFFFSIFLLIGLCIYYGLYFAGLDSDSIFNRPKYNDKIYISTIYLLWEGVVELLFYGLAFVAIYLLSSADPFLVCCDMCRKKQKEMDRDANFNYTRLENGVDDEMKDI